jgi:ketosteroid isomerase-like protein
MEIALDMQHELSLKNACVEFMFAYQQKNIDKMLSLCDEEGIVEFIPLGDAGIGKIGELGKGIWTALIDCFPDIDNTLDAAVAEDDNVIRCQVVIRGTQKKDFANIISKGKSFDSDHIFVFRFNDDNIIEHITVSWDHADFQEQLS